MYILLTGVHPIHKKGDSMETYISRLSNMQWSFPKGFSELAQSLFLELVKVNPLERYTAKEALNHPWITRSPGDIPLSYTEAISYNTSKTNLLNVILYFNVGV